MSIDRLNQHLTGKRSPVQGNNLDLLITVYQEDGVTPFDLTDADEVEWHLVDENFGEEVILLKTLLDGITIEGSFNEKAKITLSPTDLELPPRVYTHELIVIGTGYKQTVSQGMFDLRDSTFTD